MMNSTRWLTGWLGLVGICCTASAAVGQGWHVETDPLTEIVSHVKALYIEHQVPASVEAMAFEITRDADRSEDLAHSPSLEAKKATIDGWQRKLVELLQEEGYEELDDSDLQERAGLTRSQMQDMIVKRAPFGQREAVAQHAAANLYVLSDDTADCAGSQGATLALVWAYYPNANVNSDYGSTAFFLMGVGECGQAEAGRELEKAKHDVETSFTQALRDGQ